MKRLSTLREQLLAEDKLPFLVSDLVNIRYLTGFNGTNGALIVFQDRFLFITDPRYEEYARHLLASEIEFMLQGGSIIQSITDSLTGGGFLFVEDHHMKIATYNNIRSALRKKRIRLRPGGSPVNRIRMVKDSLEIEILSEAARITDRCVEHLLTMIKPGVGEIDIANEIDYFYRKNGCRGTSFPSIVASGAGSSMPHYETSETKKVEHGDTLMIDMGCVYRGYNSDLTRTFFVGSINQEIAGIYSVVLEAQQKAVHGIRPGMTAHEADAVARDVIDGRGYGDYFGHSLGHGFGCEIHEMPALRKNGDILLEPGMCVTVEPGIYLPGKGGVRIEDMVVLGDRANRVLTNYPREIQVIG